MKKVYHKEIEVNVGTLEAHGEYVDKIYLSEEDIFIRLTVKLQPPRPNIEGAKLAINN